MSIFSQKSTVSPWEQAQEALGPILLATAVVIIVSALSGQFLLDTVPPTAHDSADGAPDRGPVPMETVVVTP